MLREVIEILRKFTSKNTFHIFPQIPPKIAKIIVEKTKVDRPSS